MRKISQGPTATLTAALVTTLLGGCSADALMGSNAPEASKSTPPKERCAQVFAPPTGERPPKSVTVLLADCSASSYVRNDPSQRQDWASKLGSGFPTPGS
ncbi:hypothetical protein SMC26_25405 [Actinomadura fulvescens]|uniref:Lipoprotein n=1 Tax=Actinomadura fulvescens TaxID=46160 RepID=A0ABN3Q5G1_9ACTN